VDAGLPVDGDIGCCRDIGHRAFMHVSAGWAQAAVEQSGVIARRQLGGAGLPYRTISRMVESGELRIVAPAVFIVRGAPLTLSAKLWVAVLLTDGVIGFASAGHLWGMQDQVPMRVHVCIPHPIRSRAPDWIRLHRVPVPAAQMRRRGQVPARSRAWTALDLIGCLRPRSEASRLMDRALQRGWLSAHDVVNRLRDYPHRRGGAQLRSLAAHLGDGAVADSERLLHSLLRQAGIRNCTEP
jgi:hypothetical protein